MLHFLLHWKNVGHILVNHFKLQELRVTLVLWFNTFKLDTLKSLWIIFGKHRKLSLEITITFFSVWNIRKRDSVNLCCTNSNLRKVIFTWKKIFFYRIFKYSTGIIIKNVTGKKYFLLDKVSFLLDV